MIYLTSIVGKHTLHRPWLIVVCCTRPLYIVFGLSCPRNIKWFSKTFNKRSKSQRTSGSKTTRTLCDDKNGPYHWNIIGRFPFDQKFRKFRVWERMEQTFSGISFRNFGCTSRGWPKIPENRNNRKIPFHSTIPARAQFLRARKSNSTWLPILLLNISVPLVNMRQMTWMFFCTGATANFRK